MTLGGFGKPVKLFGIHGGMQFRDFLSVSLLTLREGSAQLRILDKVMLAAPTCGCPCLLLTPLSRGAHGEFLRVSRAFL